MCAIHFFPLTFMCQTRIYLSVPSKKKTKINKTNKQTKEKQTSCTTFLQTGTWNLSEYSGCFQQNLVF